MLADHVGELLAELGVPLAEALEVARTELDDVLVRHEHAALSDDLLLVGRLPLQRGGHLDGLHDAAEHAGEGTLDEAFEPTLEALQHSHAGSPSLSAEIVSALRSGLITRRSGPPYGC